MASLIRNKASEKDIAKGRTADQFRIEFNFKGKRNSLWCGRIDRADAELMCKHIEHIVRQLELKRPMQFATSEWLAGLGARWYDRLADFGLVPPREDETKSGKRKIGAFLDEYLATRTDAKASTLVHWRQSAGSLVDFFGKDREIDTITVAEAKSYARWLRTGAARKNRYLEKKKVDGLSQNTANKRVTDASQFFNYAVDAEILARNPFSGLGGTVKGNKRRQCFVDRETFAKVIDAAPNNEWRLILTLARYGGLRVPSELVQLTWDDIDWAGQRMTIHASKTEHHADEGIRIVPIFPEIRPYLDAAWDEAEKGAVKVLPRLVPDKNMRTRLLRIINRAGLKPWPKLWQNLRASRATELASEYPAHFCTAWMGHTERIAQDHYWMVRDEDYKRAAQSSPQSLLYSADSARLPGVSHNAENPVFLGKRQVENSGGNTGNPPGMIPDGYPLCRDSRVNTLPAKVFDAVSAAQPDLQRVISAWPRLTAAVRQKILRLLDE